VVPVVGSCVVLASVDPSASAPPVVVSPAHAASAATATVTPTRALDETMATPMVDELREDDEA
ncbi:MAG: hypothetical protein KBB21_18025, partial [Nannocystaceae bacterium]|nr:hypothetical protein [Nannocystaceae bacterium]